MQASTNIVETPACLSSRDHAAAGGSSPARLSFTPSVAPSLPPTGATLARGGLNPTAALCLPTEKRCSSCRVVKPQAAFAVYRGKLRSDCRQCRAEGVKRFQSDRKRRSEYMKAYRVRRRLAGNPVPDYVKDRTHKNARARVRRALRAGRLTKMPCEVCGNTVTEAHHDDYSKPLDVRWLCHEHHVRVRYPQTGLAAR